MPEPITPDAAAAVEAVIAAQEATRDVADDLDREDSWTWLTDEVPAGWAGEDLDAGLVTAARGLGRSSLSQDDMVHVFDSGVVDAIESVGRVRSQLDGIMFTLASEANARGLHTATGTGLVDWLRSHCPWLPTAEAGHLRQVVEASATPWGAPLGDAVRTGATGLARAAQVARTIRRLASSLTSEDQEAYAAIATAAACNVAISEKDLSTACKKLLVDLLDEAPDGKDDPRSGQDGPGDGDDGGDGSEGDASEGDGQDGPTGTAGAGDGTGCGQQRSRQQIARELRNVTKRDLGEGMTRYTFDAPEDDAAIFDGILNGPLARPVPGEDGTPDPRLAGQRRYDAFKTVVWRGLGNPGAPPSSARASVIVTVKADPATGRPTGAAFTQTGQVFPADAAGPFACTGDLTPVVLGEHGEPLHLGRTQRLASPGQFKALIVRDRGCVYPGCTVPGTWCEAHHIVWWSRGGGTDIDLLALLCPRHHQNVHDKDLTITIDGALATVHLR